MKPSEIITMARNQTWTSTDLVDQSTAFQYLNIVEKDFWRDISNESIWDKVTNFDINTVAWTSKYSIPATVPASTLSNTTWGMNQILKAGIKFSSSDVYYTPLQIKYIEWYLNLPDFYAVQTSKAIPTAYIVDMENIVVFPTPDASLTAWLQLRWPKAVADKTTSTEDVEGMILVDSDVHWVIVEWLKVWFYGQRGTDFEWLKAQAQQNYEAAKLRAINQLSNKNILADEYFNLDLTYLG